MLKGKYKKISELPKTFLLTDSKNILRKEIEISVKTNFRSSVLRLPFNMLLLVVDFVWFSLIRTGILNSCWAAERTESSRATKLMESTP